MNRHAGTILCLVLLALAVVWPCSLGLAAEDVVESRELIRQLQKPKGNTRGFVVQGKEAPSATIYVYFVYGTVEFADERSRQQLDELGRALTSKSLAGARFEISGHTDSVGSEPYNLDLSLRRAEAVNAYLMDHFGHPGSRIRGYGETRPIASNETREGRARNRRVVITRLD